jgi:serine/threonine-protein kinase
LGKYEVCAKIAGGGMATVHLGRKIGKPDELVALKVMSDAYYDNEAFVDMFLDEARILKKLSHRNVIHTYDFGSQGPHRYIAMELLLGRPLVDAWEICSKEKTRLPLTLAAWICARVAEGVHSAHELKDDDGEHLNVIHRDVNPSNVFLLYDGRVKLIDFGLAKSKRRKSTSEEGIVKGKIPYLAPEQAALGAFDRRVDVYSLGITLWELGTGKRLFKRDTDVETVAAIRKAHVPDPRDIVLTYPDALYRILERALRVNPDERYPNAEEMRQELDAFVKEHAETNMEDALAMYMKGAFAGEEERQREWLARATEHRARDMARTLPPPVPVPDAATLENRSGSSLPPPPEPEAMSLSDIAIPSTPAIPAIAEVPASEPPPPSSMPKSSIPVPLAGGSMPPPVYIHGNYPLPRVDDAAADTKADAEAKADVDAKADADPKANAGAKTDGAKADDDEKADARDRPTLTTVRTEGRGKQKKPVLVRAAIAAVAVLVVCASALALASAAKSHKP